MIPIERQQQLIAEWLALYHPLGEVFELRALGVQGKKAVSEFFGNPSLAAATAAIRCQDGAMGVYFTPNPLRPDILGQEGSARKADVAARHWLLIDTDATRPADHVHDSATEQERQSAWDVMAGVRGTLEQAGLTGSILSDSGNGWHSDCPILLPNDDVSQELIKGILKGLAKICDTERASVDCKCFDAVRIWKVPGTMARKGTPTAERPHRYASVIEGKPWNRETAECNTALLPRLLEHWRFIEDQRKGRTLPLDIIERAKAYIKKEPPAISGSGGSNRCYHVACVLVKDFGLDINQAFEAIQDWNATCKPPWSEAELRHKLESAAKASGPVGRLIEGEPPSANGTIRATVETSSDPLDEDATAADLVEANVTVRWAWPKWIPSGVLTVLASEPGVGKTRLCADLARRIWHGLPWPDGELPTFPRESRTLWVPADNQHSELGSLPKDFNFPATSLFLNATRRNPFGGTLLDAKEDLKDFEARIKRIKPAIVFVDTALNATDKSSHKPEDAKAFFVPLQQIAGKLGVCIVCVTHLNAAGKPLGRRIMGQARVVIQMECPDPDQFPDRRKLYVTKSNSLYPPALGVTLGESGNQYDGTPPDRMEVDQNGQPKRQNSTKTAACREWLRERLKDNGARVYDIRRESDAKKINPRTLYDSMRELGVDESEVMGKKYWRLPGEAET